MINLKRSPEETEREYIWRLASAMDAGQLDVNWSELTDILNAELRPEFPFSEATYRKPYTNAKSYYDDVFSRLHSSDVVDQYKSAKRELQIERVKLQTEKIENNRWLREYARDELICEKIVDAINNTTPLTPPRRLNLPENERGYVLCFGDEHYGPEFVIRGLRGEIINAYSPEIFEQRMESLFSQVINIVEKEDITDLYVFNMGDFSDGILRVKQLMKLRYGVIEGSVRYAKYLANWLNELSNYVRIHFQMAFGNHSELRMLNQPKGTFTDDNTGIVVREIISISLADNPNFVYDQNPTGLIFDEICGLNILGIHGECKNMTQAIKDFSNTYKTSIDILVGGHLHHSQSENVGVSRDVIRIPSVIGIDDFSMDLNKTSNPGATLFVLERGRGKVLEYNIKL